MNEVIKIVTIILQVIAIVYSIKVIINLEKLEKKLGE